MAQDMIMIPQETLVTILKLQPESVLIKLFDDLIISSEDSPLSDEEKIDIENAKQEYYSGETIAWQR